MTARGGGRRLGGSSGGWVGRPGAGGGGRTAAVAASAALGGRNLVLVGPPGTGKTTLGLAAARALRRPFCDTDAEVQRRAGRTIPELFEELGEAGFRELEADAVRSVAQRHGRVVATGGGSLGRAENVRALRASGLLVCLGARPEVILARVGGLQGAQRRPLLAQGDPLARIQDLLTQRAAAYAQADVHLDTSDLDREAALEALLRLCAGHPGPR